MRVMVKICWVISAITAVVGILFLIAGFAAAESAPQEASAAGLAIGIAAIPYVFARAMHSLFPDEPP
jgi:hypothetical protein